MSVHLSFSDKAPVLAVNVVTVDEHGELDYHKWHFGVVPVVSPLGDKHFQKLFIHLGLVVVRLTLIIDKALCTVGSDALEHGLVKSACSERGLGAKRLGPAGFASRIFLCFVPAALGIFLIELVYLGLPLSLPLMVFTEIFQVILKGLAIH